MRLRALLLLPLLALTVMPQNSPAPRPDASKDETEAAKNREVAKTKGIALLLELRVPISQIKSPYARVNAQLTAAHLLRDNNYKAASKYLSDAVAEVKALFAAANADDDPEQSMAQFGTISQLRTAGIQILAETDPDAALSFLSSTSLRYSPYGNPNELADQESALELSIVNQIGRKDPRRALEIAKQNLKKAYSPQLINTASQLAEKNPELAKELMGDIASKMLGEEKLISRVEAANLAISLTTYYAVSEKHVEFKPNEQNGRIPAFQSLHAGLVSEQDFKQLVQKMVREVLSFSPANGNGFSSADALWTVMSGLKSLGPELDKVVSGSTAALEKKGSELTGNVNNQWVNRFEEYQKVIANDSGDAALEAIEKAPTELREQLYVQLATKQAGNGDLNRAKQIVNEHVTNPYQRNQMLRAFDEQELE